MKKKAISIVCIVLAFLSMVTPGVSVYGTHGTLAPDGTEPNPGMMPH